MHREGAGALFGMGDAPLARAWTGLYEVTPDANPIIGAARDLPGFHLITGFSDDGFQHSPAAGRILADVITGRDPGMNLAPVRARALRRVTPPRTDCECGYARAECRHPRM